MPERRRSEREELPRRCKASFEHEGQWHEAVLTDISAVGAGVVVYRPRWDEAPRVGAPLPLRLVLPDGETGRQGRVVWVDAVTGGRRFGIEFVD